MNASKLSTVERLAEELVARLTIELEASGRHVHLSRADVETLFGAGELPRLAQILRPVQLVAPAEERLQIPAAEVDVPSAGLDLNGHAGHDFLRQAVNLHLL